MVMSKLKKVLALGLSILTVASVIVQPVFAAGSSYYRTSLGTNLALGSPLSNPDFSSEDWDKWEILVFGMFMSNYCQIGVDDYSSAFASGSKGLAAMQFAAGGDVNSNGILRKMINVATTAQQTNLSQIQVRYNYWEVGEKTQLDLGMRSARFMDLVPTITGSRIGGKSTFGIDMSANIEQPVVATTVNKELETNAMLIVDASTYSSEYEDASYTNSTLVALPSNALIPTFTVSVNGELKTVFDFMDGYDSQLMSSVIGKMTERIFEDLCESNPELKFDAFGNICAMHGGKPVVIIPAAANKNIQKNKEVNLLNSLIVNSLMLGNSEAALKVLASESYMEDSNALFAEGKLNMNGLPAVANTEKIKSDKLIMYSDTDPLLINDLYKVIRSKNSSIAESTIDFVNAQADRFGIIGQSNTSEVELKPDETTAVERGTMGGAPKKISYEDLSLGSYINKVVDKNSLYGAPFKIEVTGYNNAFIDFGTINHKKATITDDKAAAQVSLTQLGNISPYYLPENSLSEMLLVTGGTSTRSVELLSGSYFITPGANANAESVRPYKDFAAYALKNFSGQNSEADSAGLRSVLKTLKQPREILRLMTFTTSPAYNATEDTGGYDFIIGEAYKNFLQSKYNLKSTKFASDNIKFNKVNDYLGKVKSSISPLYDVHPEIKDITRAKQVAYRVCRVYKPSAAFEVVSNIFDLNNSALFSEYTTGMYISYLDWYGILNHRTDEDLRFDTTLFEGKDYLNIDPDDLIDAMSDEEKEKVLRDNTLKLTDLGESGRSFRQQLFNDLISDSFDSAYQSSASGDGLGFLNVNGYKDNMLTAYLLENYERFADVFVGLLIIIVAIKGRVGKKGLSWTVFGILAVMFSVGTAPAWVDIAPYICNSAIQEAFQENALYWLASEEISNTAQAKDMQNDANDMAGLTNEEERKAVVMMNSMRVQQSDSSLLVKLDTSKKVIEQISIGWEELQKSASTRWLVPNLIQQISGDNGTYDYVYISTYDWLNNMTRGYLASLTSKDAADASGVPKTSEDFQLAEQILAGRFYTGEYNSPTKHLDLKTLDSKKNHFKMYKDTSSNVGDASESYKSITRLNGEDSNYTMAHTFIYMMDTSSPIKYISESSDSTITTEHWDKLAESPASYVSPSDYTDYNSNKVLNALNNYNRYDIGIHSSFTNLWCTENIGLYFYTLVKDTLPISKSNTEYIAHQLAGSVANVADENGEDTEDKVRTSFMHQGTTGYVRDFLDLEEIFTNMLPYLYAEQIIMGGTDGKSGVLGDSLMENEYEVYKDSLQSWLYRSNWVTKIISDARYSKEAEVSYYSGNERQTVTIANMVDPRSYPIERPMVFSEAQQKAQGLSNKDLNLLELKLVRINNEVCDEWTMLVNYANLEGMTAETMERLMAVIATLKFNEIVTRTSISDITMSQYPKHLDMRNITWDAIMRHIVVSSSRNSTYITSPHLMSAIIDTCGIFIGFIALVVTWLSASVLPAGRDILLSLMLLLTLLSIVFNLYEEAKVHIRSTAGWAGTYALFGAYTAFFYYLIAKMTGNGNTDAILIGNMMSISTSSLTFKMLLMLLLDCLYIFGLVYFMKNIVFKGGLNGLKAYIKDGGFSFFYNVASNMTRGINRGLHGVSKSVRNSVGGLDIFSRNKQEVVPKNDKDGKPLQVTITGGKVGTYPVNTKNSDIVSNSPDDMSYTIEDIVRTSKTDVEYRKSRINAEIAKGKQSKIDTDSSN